MTVDSFSDSSEDVLNDLDPLSRALLDLSVQRGMDDGEIAQVLGTDEDSVFEVRVGLLRGLAERVAPEQADAELPELEAAVVAQLYPEVEAEAPPAVEEAAQPEPEPRHEPPERRRRSPLVVLLPLLLLITIAALIIALTSGGDEAGDEPAAQDQPRQQPDKPAPDGPAEPRGVRLTPLGSGSAEATAALSGNKLDLRASGLPDPQGGVYTVWLYDSIIDAKRLTDVRGRGASATLPKDTKGYEFIDVSLEPRDGNANHSGRSVLRIELEKLR